MEYSIRGGFSIFLNYVLSPDKHDLYYWLGGKNVCNLYYTEDNKKEFLIQKLLLQGIFKKGEQHLFELTIDELEEEYARLENP